MSNVTAEGVQHYYKNSNVTAKRAHRRYKKKKSTLPLKEYNVGTENSNVNDSLSHYRLCSLWHQR